MYTQYRGFLLLSSIGRDGGYAAMLPKFQALQEHFRARTDVARAFVVQDTVLHNGSNGSVWVLIGSEHKNYDHSMDSWLETIVREFPCEGRIEKQYEEESPGENIRVWIVTPHATQEMLEKTGFSGYGFDGADTKYLEEDGL